MDMMQQIEVFRQTLWQPDDLIELRALHGERRPWQRWWKASDLPAHAEELLKLNQDGWNIYAGVAPRKRHKGARAADVQCVRALYADLDHCTVDEALVRLSDTCLPQPTLVIASGHGVHLYWLLAEPISGGDLEALRNDLDAIAVVLKGDRKVKDLPRIMRLPGFMNVKDPAKPVPCAIHKCEPERVYPLSEFFDAILDGQN